MGVSQATKEGTIFYTSNRYRKIEKRFGILLINLKDGSMVPKKNSECDKI